MKCSNCHRTSDFIICQNCWQYAISQLGKFPQRYNDLESELLPSTGRQGERVQSSKEAPIPVRLETLHLRSGGISNALTGHEARMREIRQETRITFRGEEIHRITKTCHYLISHADWAYKEYAHVEELTKDIISIASNIQRILGYKSEEITIGKCPTIGEDGQKCSSKLKIDPTKLDRTLEIKCRRCDTVWDSTKWRLLGKMLDA
jgi:hypothetical protein